MRVQRFEQLAKQFSPGCVYRREALLPYSKAVDRDLAALTRKKVLEKVAPGLYYSPKRSRFGALPPKNEALVKAFLRDDNFLLFSQNEYNSLNLGLTQLYNRTVVYNQKRHGLFRLGSKEFDFRRPASGFPKKISVEFLIVDLLNNLNNLSDENSEKIKEKLKNKLSGDFFKKIYQCAKKYGKVSTKKFIGELMKNDFSS